MKRCICCGIERDIEQFGKKKGYSDGRRSRCNKCRRKEGVEYRKNNCEKIRDSRSRRYRQNPKKVMEQSKRWAHKNPAKIKLYKAKSPEKQKKWNSNYKKSERGRMVSINYNHKRRQIIKMVKSDITHTWLIKKRHDTKTCEICSKPITPEMKIHLDHILPLAMGGLHLRYNVRFIHGLCNLRRPKDGKDIYHSNTVLDL